MEPNKTSHRIHPLVAAAAVSVLLVSLVGVAAMTGLLPSSHGTAGPTMSSVADETKSESRTDSISNDKQGPSTICTNCGKVESIQAIKQTEKPSGVGVVAGAMIGGVLGNQVGAGRGRTAATVAGAVGGGFAGNEVEKRTHTTTTYQVHVRMEDGRVRTFPQRAQDGWRVGDRVKVVNGTLTLES